MKRRDIKSNFPEQYIRPFISPGSDRSAVIDAVGNVNAPVMEAIEDAWDIGFENIRQAHECYLRYDKYRDSKKQKFCEQPSVKKVNIRWHIDFFIKNVLKSPAYFNVRKRIKTIERIVYFFSGLKQFGLLLLMKTSEKDMYINGHSWKPTYFFKMKKEAARLEKEGRIIERN